MELDFKRVSWSLAGTGIAIAVGTAYGAGVGALATTALGPAIGKVLEQLASTGQGLVAANTQRAVQAFAERLVDDQAVLQNRAAHALVGDCLASALSSWPAQPPSALSPGKIHKLASVAKSTWLRIASYPGIAKLTRKELGQAAHALSSMASGRLARDRAAIHFSESQWDALIRRMERAASLPAESTPAHVRRSTRRHFHVTFLSSAQSLIASDLSSGGEKYGELYIEALNLLLILQSQLSQELSAELHALRADVLRGLDSIQRRALLRHRATFAILSQHVKDSNESLAALTREVEQICQRRTSSLALDNKDPLPNLDQSLTARLLPRQREAPMLGREAELTRLSTWLRQPNSCSIAVLSGAPGSGKTRLAIEACRHARNAGWEAGFCHPEQLARFVTNDIDRWTWNSPQLIVIDDAPDVTAAIGTLIAKLASQASQLTSTPPLRILLISRHELHASSALTSVLTPSASDTGTLLATWRNGHTDIHLESHLSADAVRKIVGHCKTRTGEAVTADKVPGLARAIAASPLGSTPLLIQLAVWFSSELDPGELSARDAIFDLFREREAQEGIAATARRFAVDEDLLAALIAVAYACDQTLGLGDPFTEHIETLSGLIGASAPSPKQAHQALAHYLGKGSPRSLQPDLFSEHFFLRTIERLGLCGDNLSQFVITAITLHPATTAGFLIHCLEDFSDTSRLQETVRSHIMSRLWPIEAARAAEESASHHSVKTASLSLEIARWLLDDSATHGAPAAEILSLTSKLADRLANVGRSFEAYALTEKAADLARSLHTHSSADFWPILSQQLCNYSQDSLAVGYIDRALALAREAVEVCPRDLAADSPAMHILASAQENLAAMLHEAGLYEEALAVNLDALNTAREARNEGDEDSAAFEAMQIDNLALRYSRVGQPDKALAAARKGLDAWQSLAAAHPHKYNAALALCCHNLGNRLRELGALREARLMHDRAASIRKRLATFETDRYAHEVAHSLTSLAHTLLELGNVEAANDALVAALEWLDKAHDHLAPSVAIARFFALSLHGVLAAEQRDLSLALKHNNSAIGILQAHPLGYSLVSPRDLIGSLTRGASWAEEQGSLSDASRLHELALRVATPSQLQPRRPSTSLLALVSGAYAKFLKRNGRPVAAAITLLHAINFIVEQGGTLGSDLAKLLPRLCVDYADACDIANVEPDEQAIAAAGRVHGA